MSTNPRCEGITLKGVQCKNRAKLGERTCGIHCFQKFTECGICYETIHADKTYNLLDCKHDFCKKCINTWMIEKYQKNCSCPMCRTPIADESPMMVLAFEWGFINKYIFSFYITHYSTSSLNSLEIDFVDRIISDKKFNFKIFSKLIEEEYPLLMDIVENLKIGSVKIKYFTKTEHAISDYDILD